MNTEVQRQLSLDTENPTRGKAYTAAQSGGPLEGVRGAPRLSNRNMNLHKQPTRVCTKKAVHKPLRAALPPMEKMPAFTIDEDDYSDILPLCERLTLDERYRLLNPWSKSLIYTTDTEECDTIVCPPPILITDILEEDCDLSIGSIESDSESDELLPYFD